MLDYLPQIAWWQQYLICASVVLIFCIVISWDHYQEHCEKSIRRIGFVTYYDWSGAVGGTIFITLLAPLAIIGFIVVISISMLFADGRAEIVKLAKALKRFGRRWIDTDYIAIFLPVTCVLTLFLID